MILLSFRSVVERKRNGVETISAITRNPIRDVSTSLDMTSKTETREVYSFSLASALRAGSMDQTVGSAVHQP